MKKKLLILWFLMAGIAAFARIDNLFGALELGESDRQDVEKFIENHGFEVYEETPESIMAGNGVFSLDGINWKYVTFEFKDDKLKAITLQTSSKLSLVGHFYELKSKYDERYSDYVVDSDTGNLQKQQVRYKDKDTVIVLSREETPSITVISLTFMDVDLGRTE